MQCYQVKRSRKRFVCSSNAVRELQKACRILAYHKENRFSRHNVVANAWEISAGPARQVTLVWESKRVIEQVTVHTHWVPISVSTCSRMASAFQADDTQLPCQRTNWYHCKHLHICCVRVCVTLSLSQYKFHPPVSRALSVMIFVNITLQIQTVTLRLRQTQQSRTKAGPGLLAEVAGEGAKAGVAEAELGVGDEAGRDCHGQRRYGIISIILNYFTLVFQTICSVKLPHSICSMMQCVNDCLSTPE